MTVSSPSKNWLPVPMLRRVGVRAQCRQQTQLRNGQSPNSQLGTAIEGDLSTVSGEGAVEADGEEQVRVVDLYVCVCLQKEDVLSHADNLVQEALHVLTFVVPGRAIRTSPLTPVYE